MSHRSRPTITSDGEAWPFILTALTGLTVKVTPYEGDSFDGSVAGATYVDSWIALAYWDTDEQGDPVGDEKHLSLEAISNIDVY